MGSANKAGQLTEISEQFLWFLTRAAGIVSWFAAALSVLAGLLMATRFLGKKPTIPYLLDIHRFLAHLAVIFLGIHMITLWADSFVDVGLVELTVPGVLKIRGYDTVALGVGVIAAWIMVLVELTSLLKDRMPKTYWNAIHLNSYLVVILGTWHGVVAGSDATNRLLVGLAVTVLATITVITVVRVARLIMPTGGTPDQGATSARRPGQMPSPMVGGQGPRSLPAEANSGRAVRHQPQARLRR